MGWVHLTENSHSAARSALGYLFQSQWPLVELVRRASERPDLELTIEMYDDVSWEQEGTPQELLQLKHHLTSTRTIGDMGPDLWRTIGSWMDVHPPDDTEGPTLTLVTTQHAAEGSACWALGPDVKDKEQAKHLLEVAARESTSESTSGVRTRFLTLSDAQRSIFVGRMVVLHGASQIDDLDAELRKLLRVGLPYGQEDLFMDRLWAWWYRIVVGLLQRWKATISTLEVTQQISDLRDQFASGNLPTLVNVDDFDSTTEGMYSGRTFVEQLRWISFSSNLLQKAIVDYYRAYTQSARWVENHLVGLNELDAFEDNLKDEWERAFEFMTLRLGADPPPERIAIEGQTLFRQVTEQSKIRVRNRYDEAFFTRGKYHELADDGVVGWHLEFEGRLKALLFGEAS